MKKPLIVEWDDISLDPGWHSQDDLSEATPHPSCFCGMENEIRKEFFEISGNSL